MATFDTVSCPEQLNLVTLIATLTTKIFLHHFRHFKRVPCFSCYSPSHSSAKCGGRKRTFQAQHHRKFTGVSTAPPNGSGLTFKQLDVVGRFQHVSGLANTLVATTAKLKADDDRALLLSKISQAPLRADQSENTTASPLAGGRDAPGVAASVSGPSTNAWFDPGANKEMRDQRRSVALSGRATGLVVKPSKHP